MCCCGCNCLFVVCLSVCLFVCWCVFVVSVIVSVSFPSSASVSASASCHQCQLQLHRLFALVSFPTVECNMGFPVEWRGLGFRRGTDDWTLRKAGEASSVRHNGRNKTQTFTIKKPGKSKGGKDEWFFLDKSAHPRPALVCLFACLFVCLILCLLARMLVCSCVCLFVYVFACVLVCVCASMWCQTLCGVLDTFGCWCALLLELEAATGYQAQGKGVVCRFWLIQVQSYGWLTDLLQWVKACVCNACCFANMRILDSWI